MLGEVKNVDTKVIQIVDNLPVFATEVLGSSTANESNQNIPVVYSLGIIYDEAGKPQPDLPNYIKVDMHNGALSMGLTLDPSRVTDDLTGYKVVIGLQARKDGINYGEPAYICVELQKK